MLSSAGCTHVADILNLMTILRWPNQFGDQGVSANAPLKETRIMKILLSAYACEPNKGSEPGVGWNWTEALLQLGHSIHLITRSNNRPSIEGALPRETPRLVITYYDLPHWTRMWKRWPGGIYFYYLFWQMGAYRLARELHALQRFDRVQHSTFASFRQPSFMGRLGIPFIFGPVGGGRGDAGSLSKGNPARGEAA